MVLRQLIDVVEMAREALATVKKTVEKPWGSYLVLWRGPDALLKRLMLRKGGAISYQYHLKRKEVWTVVSGIGLLTLDGAERLLTIGQTVVIEREQRHSVEATSAELVIYELQVGECDEDDIVRISDKYGRT